MNKKIIDIDLEFDSIHFDEHDIKHITRISKMILTKTGSKGPKHTEQTKRKISKNGKGIKKPPRSEKLKKLVADKLRGRKRSPEHCQAISNGLKGHKTSKERKAKISAGLKGVMKGVPKRKTICPHCGKEGGIAPMTRFHGDNCKQAPK